MEIFVNPLFEGLQNKIRFMWPEATLAPLLDRITYFATLGSKNSINDIPWVNDHIKWLPQANALVILELGIGFLVVSSLLYLSLLVRMLHQRCKDGDIPDINYISYAKRLAESTNVPRLVEEMKQEERDMTGALRNFPYAASSFFIIFYFFGVSFFLHGPSRGATPPSGADWKMQLLELHNIYGGLLQLCQVNLGCSWCGWLI